MRLLLKNLGLCLCFMGVPVLGCDISDLITLSPVLINPKINDFSVNVVNFYSLSEHQLDDFTWKELVAAYGHLYSEFNVASVMVHDMKSIDNEHRNMVIATDHVDIPLERSHNVLWLIPKENFTSNGLRLDSLVFPYECKRDLKVWEAYSVLNHEKENHLSSYENNKWSKEFENIWTRRQNLEGANLINIFLEFDRFTRAKGGAAQNANGQPSKHSTKDFEGLGVAVVQYLEDTLNFTTTWVIILFENSKPHRYYEHL